MEDIYVWLLVGGLVFGAIIAYVVLMIFLPEWVGITGKAARDAQKSHREDNRGEKKDTFDSNLDKWQR
jgi:hypothetical protein